MTNESNFFHSYTHPNIQKEHCSVTQVFVNVCPNLETGRHYSCAFVNMFFGEFP